MALTSDSIYQEVAALTEVTSEMIPANGVSWEIQSFTGNGAYDASVTVKLVWDFGGGGETVLVSTHGDLVDRLRNDQVTGDGVKKLAIVLDNQSNTAQTIGGQYEAKIL